MPNPNNAAVQETTDTAAHRIISFDLQRFADAKVVTESTVEAPASQQEQPVTTTGSPDVYAKFELPADVVAYDDNIHTTFSTVAKKYNLTQEAAQEFVNMYAGFKLNEAKAIMTEHEERVKGWETEAKSDPVIARNFEQNIASAKESFKRFGGDELLQLLDDTGLGNHPLFIKMGMELKARISEDQFPTGTSPNSGVKSIAELLYPFPSLSLPSSTLRVNLA